MTLAPTSTRTPDEALTLLLSDVSHLENERVPLARATGRVLAQSLVTDRPSPACDVSAMDGFALRIADVSRDSIAIGGQISAGDPQSSLPRNACARIATGASIPLGADLVIPREHVDERGDSIAVQPSHARAAREGAHIRRCGENALQGTVLLERGAVIHAATAAALAAFGVTAPLVTRTVRVAALITGDEIVRDGEPLQPWCVRDSNGPALSALFAEHSWVEPFQCERVPDDATALRDALTRATATHDLVLVTGGVAVGHHDFVASTLEHLHATIHFHGVAQRPGRPLLGASLGRCRVLGLPGNPVSVLTTARRYALPLARCLAGFSAVDAPFHTVTLDQPIVDALALTRFLPVRPHECATVRRLASRGSGDVAAIAASSGFIEIPPFGSGIGPWRFFAWS